MSLNQIQSSEVVRAISLEAFLAVPKNNLIYKTYEPFNSTRLIFGLNVGKLGDLAKVKEKSGAGTVTKWELQRDIAKRLSNILKLTRDYAIKKNDTKLKVLVSFSQTTISEMKDPDLQPFVTGLAEKVFTDVLLTNVDFMKYEIDAADIASLVADANSFNNMIGDNTKDGNASSTANDTLDLVIEDVHSNIESFKNTAVHFENTNPEFVDGLFKNMEITVLGVRHEGLRGIVRNGGLPVRGALVKVEGTKKEIKTGADGSYELYIHPGIYNIIATLANGEKLSKVITVLYRTMLEIDFDIS